ncbi:hypothetical protein [Tistrella mobilis]|uniref:hypothetical protein n=1 Tax=Tistrella mobilis TaxID=171437 RepID=UPI0035569CB6
MTKMTDCARELADCLSQINQRFVDSNPANYLAKHFEVYPWSGDFYLILSIIQKRISDNIKVNNTLYYDEDTKEELERKISSLFGIFSGAALVQGWATTAHSSIVDAIFSLKLISPRIRDNYGYPAFDDDDIKEILSDVSTMIEWLKDHQMKEKDFIRQALLDGLIHLEFSLKKFKWLGQGYNIQSLREVVSAYMALEQEICNHPNNDIGKAAANKCKKLISTFFDRIKGAKDIYETTDFLLKTYGAASLYIQGSGIINGGLLTFGD